MAHAASDDVNEKSYILDARKNFEDVSKVIKKRLSCFVSGCGLPRRPTLAFPVSFHFREIISRCTQSDDEFQYRILSNVSVFLTRVSTSIRLTGISRILYWIDIGYCICRAILSRIYFNESFNPASF